MWTTAPDYHILWLVQIRLSPGNAKKLKELVKVYGKTCPEYNLSATQQINLLIAGRLGLALQEAEAELKKSTHKKSCAQ